MYHQIRDNVGLCQGCCKWCERCNQCKCEIGLKRLCPGFDVKEHPIGFEHWKVELELDRLYGTLTFGNLSRTQYHTLVRRIDELENDQKQLAAGL